MLKKIDVVMLPTKEKAQLYLTPKGKLDIGDEHIGGEEYPTQHLYFLSDEEIKEGDWYYQSNKFGNVIDKCDEKTFVARTPDYVRQNGAKKIIATTDKSLKLYEAETITRAPGFSLKTDDICLPQPSPEFLKVFVREYNKGNQIEQVMVEYEAVPNEYDNPLTNPEGKEDFPNSKWELKTNPIDNTICIKPIKDSWTRDEVSLLIRNTYVEAYEKGYSKSSWGGEIDKWIEQNI